MGTEITLSLGGIALDYSKNHRGNDHGSLFQDSDRTRYLSDEINYDYFKEEGDDAELVRMEAAFVRPLASVVPRLELLGRTMDSIARDYDGAVRRWNEEALEDDPPHDPMLFEEFRAFLARHPIGELDGTFISGFGTSEAEGRFAGSKDVGRIPNSNFWASDAYSEQSYFGNLIGFLHPYCLLRLLAEVPANKEFDLVWQYGPLVENGWAKVCEFIPGARRRERFLIATEGSSDVHILKHAFALLRPLVSDFFHFIDVSESHPFSGTGSLRKFAEGLAKIDVQNQTVFVFDNDAEGVEARQKVEAMALPGNMSSMILPDLEVFRSFPILGPEGPQKSDINGRAAAIECYLDLNLKGLPPAQATWSNHKKDLGRWQGALDNKDAYVKPFLNLGPHTLATSGYDTSKIERVLDAIIVKSSQTATSVRDKDD